MTASSPVAVHLRGATFSHSATTLVLDDATLDLGPGVHGLVGPNGAGKSTLLDLLDGTLEPASGTVQVVADGPLVRIRQHPDRRTEDVDRLGARWDGPAVTTRRRLGLDVDDLWRWDTRSPGVRMRWQVAAGLARDPDVLLLDEPTNHLDTASRRLLVDAIATAGVPLVLVVSHDRGVLDELTTSTVRIADGAVRAWAGHYSAARPRWEAARARAVASHDRARREAAVARTRLARARSDLSGIERGAAATRRAAGHRRPDAREAGGKHNAAAAAKSLASTVGARRSAVERSDRAVADSAVARRRGGPVVARGLVARADLVARLDAAVVAVDGHEVLRDVAVALAPGDRVRIAGRNGAGKSTLLRALVDRVRAGEDAGGDGRDAVGVLDQEVALSARERDRLLAVDDRHRVLAVVDRLGADPERVATTSVLSPGETRKLVLADLLARPRSLLVLDEPTTHLDIDAIERLQATLAEHPGTLLLVTHDDHLADAVTATTWTVAGGHVTTDAGADRPRASGPV